MFRALHTLVLCLLVCTVGDNATRRPGTVRPVDPQLAEFRTRADESFRRGDYIRSRDLYRRGLRHAVSVSDLRSIARFHTGVANCAMALMQFREASMHYSEAAAIARKTGDNHALAVVGMNQATLYRRMGDTESALRVVRDLERTVPLGSMQEYSARFQMVAGSLYRFAENNDRAIPALEAAIVQASLTGDRVTEAEGWNRLGYLHLERRDTARAELALIEAYRIRSTATARNLTGTYFYIGLLRMAQNRPEDAIRWFDRALAHAGTNPAMPLAHIYERRGRANLKLDRLRPALTDLKLAVERARHIRHEIVPSDGSRSLADASLHRIYEGYITAGMRAFKQIRGSTLGIEMFEAAEQGRALSFREQLQQNQELPPEYWQTISDISRAGIRAANANQADPSLDLLQLKAQEIEVRVGLFDPNTRESSHQKTESISPENSLNRYQRALSPSEAMISFHLGEEESYRWSVTRNSFAVESLPPRAELRKRVQQLRDALQASTPEALPLGQELYNVLFRHLSPPAQAAVKWILVLDDSLFAVPFAALRPNASTYLVEKHSLRILPSARMLFHRRSFPNTGLFVGFGDPIYSAADPRSSTSASSSWVRFASTAASAAKLELPRLIGSKREIETAAAAFQPSQSIQLIGRDASRDGLTAAMRRRPAVVHLATHVVSPASPSSPPYIALGLDRTGSPEFLTSAEIASRRAPVGMVVLSGCASGTGKVLPGSGLFGLTRSLLIMGAQTVAASHWPTPDDTGELFQSMYQALRAGPAEISSSSAAAALQAAQVRMLRSQTWRARPAYWSAFFIIGKD